MDPIVYVVVSTLGQETEYRFEEVSDKFYFDDADIVIDLKHLYDKSFSTFWKLAQKVHHDFGSFSSSCLLKATDIRVTSLAGEYVFDAYFIHNDGNDSLYLSNTNHTYKMNQLPNYSWMLRTA